jgi:hypothetical protein
MHCAICALAAHPVQGACPCRAADWLEHLRRIPMISATTAMPMPETGPSIGRSWIKANIIIAAIYAVAGTLTVVTDKLVAVNDPATAMTFRGFAAAIALVGTIVPIVAYAMLTGSVIGEKLPAFSKRAWVVMHGSIGAILGIFFAASTLLFGSIANNATPPTPPMSVLAIGFGIVIVVAALFGAAMGGLQALVLRKAATGTSTWIILSALAVPLMFMVLGGVAFALRNSGFASTLIMQAVSFVTMVGVAIMMLPALNRLVPRS